MSPIPVPPLFCFLSNVLCVLLAPPGWHSPCFTVHFWSPDNWANHHVRCQQDLAQQAPCPGGRGVAPQAGSAASWQHTEGSHVGAGTFLCSAGSASNGCISRWRWQNRGLVLSPKSVKSPPSCRAPHGINGDLCLTCVAGGPRPRPRSVDLMTQRARITGEPCHITAFLLQNFQSPAEAEAASRASDMLEGRPPPPVTPRKLKSNSCDNSPNWPGLDS